MSKNEYKGLIITNHALERMKQRGISYSQVWETQKYPDFQDTIRGDATERKKMFENRTVSVVFTHNGRGETVVISCWMEPPLPGSADAKQQEWYKKYKKAGFWGKIWLELTKQFWL